MKSNQLGARWFYGTHSMQVCRHLSVCLLILLIVVHIMSEAAEACYTSSYFNKRRRSSEHPFIREEYQPRSLETDFMASGPLYYSDLVYNPKTLQQIDIGPNSGIVVAHKNASLMTKECAERVNSLKLWIQETWSGQVKLFIRDAWLPPRKIHKPMGSTKGLIHYSSHRSQIALEFRGQDFHSAGRAIDFSLTRAANPSETMNLGKLAQLAYYRAKFSWCRFETGNFIHCSVKATSFGGSGTFACFPGSSTVTTESGGRKPLSQLQINDRVLAIDPASGMLVYSKVELFLHRQPDKVTSFLQLETTENSSLILSANHLIYRQHSVSSFTKASTFSASTETVYAADIRIGDRILTTGSNAFSGGIPRPVKVISRRWVISRGIYAPLTDTGNIIIDGHVASCYALVRSEHIARWSLFPYQLLHRWWDYWAKMLPFLNSSSHHLNNSVENGVHWYAWRLYSIAHTVLPSNWLFPD